MSTRDRALPFLLVSNAAASIGTGVAMIAIPWLLAEQPGGGIIFGGLATTVNLALFVVTPFIGPLIDRTSRKSLMLRLRALYVVGLLMIWAADRWLVPDCIMVSMAMYYVLGASFYSFNVPLRSAYVQELFPAERQSGINALLEIENQVAAVLTGLATIFVAQRSGLTTLLAGNGALYLIAIGMIGLIPDAGARTPVGGGFPFLAALADGARLALDRPKVTIQLAASSIPYVVVIVYTVLNPVALARLSPGVASAYATVELLFALGSVAGGAVMMRARRSADLRFAPALTASLIAFAGVAVVQAMLVTASSFMALAVAFGFGNAVCRILRQSLLMVEVPTHQIGRVAAFLQSLTMLMRTVSLLALTEILSGWSMGAALWFCALLSMSAPALFVAADVLRRPRDIGFLSHQDRIP